MSDKKETKQEERQWEELDSIPIDLFDEKNPTIKPNTRTYLDPVHADGISWWDEVKAMFISFSFVGIFYYFIILFIIGYYSKFARICMLLSFLTLLIPAKLHDAKKLRSKLWNPLYKYFSYSFVWEDGLNDENVVYAEFPHGVSPMGPLISALAVTHYSDKPIYALTTKSALAIPIYHHILRWMSSISAGYKNLLWALKHGSCAVVVGGIAEMYEIYPDKEVIFLKSRKGFVRAAVESGVPIRCVYQFGNSQILDIYPRWFQSIARKLQAAGGLMVGRWGLPIPRKVPIMSCIGKDIPVKKMSREDPEFNYYVDEIHEQVIEEIQRLYHKYRKVYNWGDRPLEIK